ncbi:MAG: hypothetical protein EOO61_07005, partial [Hymenobacter sp.]
MIEVFIPIVATGLFILAETKSRWEMEAFEKKQAQGRARIEELKKATAAVITVEPSNPATAFVVELLRADVDWSEKRKTFSTFVLEHITGVRITYEEGGGAKTKGAKIHFVMIKNSDGDFKEAELSKEDKAKIYDEINAFKTRRRDAEQVDLARALAERVKARELGEVHPLLGFSGVSEGDG